jgi:hypothetical protein
MDSCVQEEEESPRFLNLTPTQERKKYNVSVEANDEKFNNFVSHKNHIPTTYLVFILFYFILF